MQTVNDIRAAFLDYFQRHDHEIVSSSALVPDNDPTLLFTNAGMVQFKNVFTGVEYRNYKRAVTSQKCVRAGGKHNDLDNVGYTARHHTFFEMLGNFSFGDYFKERAIELAWQLVTQEFGLPADRLLVTVYAEDDQAFDLWRKVAGLPEQKITRIPTSDNFWAMGETGPCGPCSEIFYDHGPDVPGGPPGSPDEDGDRFIEIWNLVFMQFEQLTKTDRVDLPKPSIDTGMGLERIAAVMQGKHDNYEIDLFQRLIEASVELTGAKAEGASLPSHKVIADHLRASSFLIADGVTPSNEGRGYVLRRIMRRGMRHAHLLGSKDPLMHRMVDTLVGEMGAAFPELVRAQANIKEWLRLEETNFRRTLERGLRLLDDETAKLGEGQKLAGEAAFKLYDTYGFPLDLTQDALRARGLEVDLAGFDAAMERQRAEARRHWKGSGAEAVDEVWFEIREQRGATEFLGYTTTQAEAQIAELVVGGQRASAAKAGDEVAVIVNQTPFYGESGGQMGDVGTIKSADASITITDTQKRLGDLWVHFGTVAEGTINTGDTVEMIADRDRRDCLRRAHSATHLLHAALRNHLGDHVAQRGSQVAPDRLRFDFSHTKALDQAELIKVEDEVNAYVRQNADVVTRVMGLDDARAAGAMALFGEKYGDEVRVVSMGTAANGDTYSLELCGGTHTSQTGDIAMVKLVADSAVAAGIRRVDALTGAAAIEHIRAQEQLLNEAATALKAAPKDLPARVRQMLEERRALEAQLADTRKKLASGGSADGPKSINGINFVGRTLTDLPAKELRSAADAIKQQIGSGVIALVAVNDGKAAMVVAVTDDLKEQFDSVAMLRSGVAALGGKGGGGRADFAQGGGPDGAAADQALAAVEQAISA